ncbi:MAG TPA: ribulokinase, partial [Sedimentisphaerales bacterium]|nr:ribulokinase [Sedimentisphaerales bacterium]
MAYTIGLDYGTNSARAILVDIADGRELASFVYEYPTGSNGIVLDESDHNLARQNPGDYLDAIEVIVKGVLENAKADKNFHVKDVIAIGVDTTGSTPLPVDKAGNALAMSDEFKDNPNAMAWLWKDHTSFAEAAEITKLARKEKPQYLAKCGGVYSSEWFFSKILHCLRVDEKVFEAAYSWVECCDFITGSLTGTQAPDIVKRSRCAAGHKAMYNVDWGGLPAKDFLSKLDSRLGDLRDRLYKQTYSVDTSAGKLTSDWAKKLGLSEGINVAVGAFDAHLGAVGSGIGPGKLVKILGTSSCDMLVSAPGQNVPDVEGICGIVDGSILPGCFGLEAGQSAVGDIFNWFVNYIEPGGKQTGSHQQLTEKATKLKPGQSGLLALDWNNGNRTVLVDQRLTGLLLGQTLHTRPEEIYRALIEATAFGALTIINQFEAYGVKVNEVVNCGGISEKNPLVLQIYADVCDRQMKISSSAHTCALGSC